MASAIGLSSLAIPSAPEVAANAAPLTEIRSVYLSEIGLGGGRPTGVTVSPYRHRLVVSARAGDRATAVELEASEDVAGRMTLPALPEAGSLFFSASGLGTVDAHGLSLVDAPFGGPVVEPMLRRSLAHAGLRDVRGATPLTGTRELLLLDRAGREIVGVEEGDLSITRRIPLAPLRLRDLRGLAYNPADGLAYVASPRDGVLLGLSAAGTPMAAYRLSSLAIGDFVGMAFAPSMDPTDDPAITTLYIADAGGTRPARIIQTALGSSVRLAAEATTAATIAGTLVATRNTSSWPSPDPSGITYIPSTDRLFVSDAEVEEMTIYNGRNMYHSTRAGALSAFGNSTAYSNEPTGVAYQASPATMYVSDDDADRIFVVRPGTNGTFGNSDDQVIGSVNVRSFPISTADAEDVTFDPSTGDLFMADGEGSEVWRIDAGSNGTFGNTDDVISHFDATQFGAGDPEGIVYDPARDTLFLLDHTSDRIYELTKSGTLLNIITLGAVPAVKAAGITLAPGTVEPGRMNFYIVDRGVDNDGNPSENDGKIFEVKAILPGSTNTAPTVTITAPANGSSFAQGASVTFSGTANDTQQGNLTSSLAWTSNIDGAIGSGGSFSTSGLSAGMHTVTASVTDSGGLTGSASITVTITGSSGNTAPTVTITAPANGSSFVQGASVTFSGTASDTQDGNLTSSLAWTSSINGSIGSGGSFSTAGLSVGTHTITASAADTGGLTGSATRTITITETGTFTIDIPIAAGSDDAEESATGAIELTSSDLEIVQETTTQKVGMRFANVTIPPGATILNAYIQFTVDEVSTAAASLLVQGQAAPNPPTFTTATGNVSSRPRTSTSISWVPAPWGTINARGPDQRTPELKTIVQQLIGQSGWASGNAMVMIITGTGKRVADAFGGGGATNRPALHVQYQVGSGGPPPNTAPSVSITAPANGSSFAQGSPVTFSGTASDTQDGSLTSSLAWTSNIQGSIGSGGSFTTSGLSVGTHTITASATDTGGLTGSASITVTISPPGNTAPSVSITAPANGSSFAQGSPVTFSGTANDAQDGNLTSSLAWTSNIDGAIGSGGSFTTSGLSVGTHTITASVTDTGGLTGSATRTVTITGSGANTAPTVSITAPANGSSFAQGAAVTFTGTASDTQDGNLTASLAWTSSIDGPIGSGGSFTTSGLSVGTHTITASVTDTGGLTGSATRTVTITGGGGGSASIDVPIATGTDDAEEWASGFMDLPSSDLEMVQESTLQKIGLRFANVQLPAGATVTNAYIQFTADELNSEATSLLIRGQAAANPGTFTTTAFDISNRTSTSASVTWAPPAWTTANARGVDQRTPNLATLIAAIRAAGFAPGNAMVFFITGSGKRVADSFEGGLTNRPVLHIDYTL